MDAASEPYKTAAIAALPMTIRTTPEDFEVEEVPAYMPSGEGDHVYLWIEKKGRSTHEVLRDLAKHLKTPFQNAGSAGLKDARAVTRQMLSFERADPEAAKALQVEGVKVLSVARHKNKLKSGHLRGNRFILKLRGIDASRFEEARQSLDLLTRQGVPNYFGDQRFGVRGDTWKIGRALLAGDFRDAASWIAGHPVPEDPEPSRRAREFFEQGDFEKAAAAWPKRFPDSVRLCHTLARNGGDFKKAFYAVDKKMMKFYVSAYQSQVFNRILAARLEHLDEVLEGDWAYKHDNGAPFLVRDAAGDLARARAFEISATGPLYGKDIREVSGRPAEIEKEVLAAEGVDPAVFSQPGMLSCAGDRRPFRIKMLETSLQAGEDAGGPYWEIRMQLPAGCYATSVLRELGKELLKDAGQRTAEIRTPNPEVSTQ